MAKNVLVGFLALLLIIAVVFIVRGMWRGDVEIIEEVEEVEITENSEVDAPTDARANLPPKDEVSIVGQWQKDDDPQSTITFHLDGTLIDTYGGGAIYEEGTYDLFDNAQDLPRGTEHNPEATFLRQTFGNESYFYEVLLLNNDSLELLFLSEDARTLKYVRVDS